MTETMYVTDERREAANNMLVSLGCKPVSERRNEYMCHVWERPDGEPCFIDTNGFISNAPGI